jgi:inorganic pyrophosphatase
VASTDMTAPPTNLAHLGAWDKDSGTLNVIVETPKGSSNKFDYNPELAVFELAKVLPKGTTFPWDFGFVPSTLGEDGDPLDVLILMDEPAFPGCKICCRLIGLIEAEQTDSGGTTVRNDRLIAVAQKCRDDQDICTIKNLPANMLLEIENFFASYHALDRTAFKPLACRGPKTAAKMVRAGVKRLRKHTGRAELGGRKMRRAKQKAAS